MIRLQNPEIIKYGDYSYAKGYCQEKEECAYVKVFNTFTETPRFRGRRVRGGSAHIASVIGSPIAETEYADIISAIEKNREDFAQFCANNPVPALRLLSDEEYQEEMSRQEAGLSSLREEEEEKFAEMQTKIEFYENKIRAMAKDAKMTIAEMRITPGGKCCVFTEGNYVIELNLKGDEYETNK